MYVIVWLKLVFKVKPAGKQHGLLVCLSITDLHWAVTQFK